MIHTKVVVALLACGFAASTAAQDKQRVTRVELRNPQSAPSGLPAELIEIVGSLNCPSQVSALSPGQFNFAANVAILPTVPGESCVAVISRMVLRTKAGQIITYSVTDKPFIVQLNDMPDRQQLQAPQDGAVSFDISKPVAMMPDQLWFTSIMVGPHRVVGIDFSRSLAIQNVLR